MTNETFKKLEYILSGYQVSKEETNDLVDLMENYAKEYHTEQLRICAVSCQRGKLCDHTWKRSDNFSGKEYCSKCPEIRYK